MSTTMGEGLVWYPIDWPWRLVVLLNVAGQSIFVDRKYCQLLYEYGLNGLKLQIYDLLFYSS